MKKIDYTGFRNGKLEVISSERIMGKVQCKCDCGVEFLCFPENIKKQKSCGCGKSRHAVLMSDGSYRNNHPLFRTWWGMLYRCNNSKSKDYKNYGGRGIHVCERWQLENNGFENFIKDMGEKPSPSHSIDRVDNDKGYSKDNCVWQKSSSQAMNRRSSNLYEFEGKMRGVNEISSMTGIAPITIRKRINSGWPQEMAFTAPVDETKRAKPK